MNISNFASIEVIVFIEELQTFHHYQVPTDGLDLSDADAFEESVCDWVATHTPWGNGAPVPVMAAPFFLHCWHKNDEQDDYNHPSC